MVGVSRRAMCGKQISVCSHACRPSVTLLEKAFDLLRRKAPLTDRCDEGISALQCRLINSAGIAMFIESLVGTIMRYARYRRQLTSISNLDDRILRDIGLNRGELRSAAWDIAAAAGWQ
jgi:uncharacterized protein YjiS (DUF1127 family)